MIFWNFLIVLVGELREGSLQKYPDYLLQTFKEMVLDAL
jgi:hypothetical protein